MSENKAAFVEALGEALAKYSECSDVQRRRAYRERHL